MNSQLLPSVAARELQTRRTIRTSLIDWCRLCGFEPAAHHRIIIEELEAVARGECDRLAIFLPPGSAKSTYASVLFPPWLLATSPESAIIAASHTQELADRWGRKVRNLILEHGPVLNVGLSPDSQAAGRWETMEGGEYFAAGVGGSITGRRADLVLIDDPVRSREDADSETSRERAWEWYRSDLLTRLKPGGRVVLIQTRWHEDDLAGRALADAQAAGRPFRVVRLPMEAEDDDPLGRAPGALLWPEYFTPEMAAEARRDARTWTALYQQRPAPEEGNYFKNEWLQPIDRMPAASDLRVYGASDYAVSAGKGDYTVHVVVGVDADQRMYLLDLWRRQATSDEWVESLCDLIGTWRPAAWAEEQGQIKAGVGPFLERRLKERQAFVYRQQFPTRGDKGVRAQSVRGRMAMNGLYVPRDAPWWPELRSELLSFPAGKHDDQVDALGLIGQLLAGEPMFSHPEEDFVCEPIYIPSTWPRIAAVELDRNRFGAIWAAWDRRNDIVYLTGETKAARSNLAIHAEALRARGKWIPVMIDMEGRKRGKEDGIKTVDRLADFGIDLYALTTDAEAGAEEIANRIATGRLKVMSPLIDWIAEYRNLRRDQKGEIAQEDDHLLQATMLALQGLDVAISENRGTSEAEEPELDDYGRNPITGY